MSIQVEQKATSDVGDDRTKHWSRIEQSCKIQQQIKNNNWGISQYEELKSQFNVCLRASTCWGIHFSLLQFFHSFNPLLFRIFFIFIPSNHFPSPRSGLWTFSVPEDHGSRVVLGNDAAALLCVLLANGRCTVQFDRSTRCTITCFSYEYKLKLNALECDEVRNNKRRKRQETVLEAYTTCPDWNPIRYITTYLSFSPFSRKSGKIKVNLSRLLYRLSV